MHLHRLAAITVTMGLLHRNTQTTTREHRPSQHSQSTCALCTTKHKHNHTHASPQSSQREHAPCAQEHTNKHEHASSLSNHCVHAPYSCTNKHTHASPRSTHNEHTPCFHKHTQKAHTCIASQQSQHCTIPITHSHTCMHRLAAITVSKRLVQAQTHTPTYMHTCISLQQ